MPAYLEQDSGFFTRRGMVLVAIILLHLLIFWALATGLAKRAVEMIAPPIQTVIETRSTRTRRRRRRRRRPSSARRSRSRRPTRSWICRSRRPPPRISNTTTQHVAPAAPKAPGVKTPPKIGKGFPNSRRFLSAASKRLDEQGAPTVKVCIGAGGKLTEPPTIGQTSGSARLDEACAESGQGWRPLYPARHRGRQADRFVLRVPHQVPDDEIIH